MAHFLVSGVRVDRDAPRGERELHMGDAYAATSQAIPAGPQYVAMGHIHAPQKVPGAPVPAEYAGSLLALDFGEAGEQKRVVIVDAEPGRLAVAETVALQGGRPLVRVTDTWDAIEARADELADAFLDLTVKTSGTDTSLAERARETFPFLVKVRAYRRRFRRDASAWRRPPGPGPSCTARTTGRSIPARSRPARCSRSSVTCWRRWAMRPHELTVEGFRSYRQKTTFDWRGRRLVGIVGPIGSGKSSIIDAISFALFGKTPAVERDTKSLIHQLCDQCHVELVFEVDGQVWRAQRALRSNGQAGSKLQLVTRTASSRTSPRSSPASGRSTNGSNSCSGWTSRVLSVGAVGAEPVQRVPEGDRRRPGQGAQGRVRLRGVGRGPARGEVTVGPRRDRPGALGDERRRIDEARARLEEARANAASAERRLQDLEAAAPEVERLTKEREAAAAETPPAPSRSPRSSRSTGSLPDPDDVDAAVRRRERGG